MRKFDTNGLRLCEFQGKIFEESVDFFDCSSPVFLRRFRRSNLLKRLDQNESHMFSLWPKEALMEIEEQFGKSEYGKKKYSKDSMFWMGYLYRYISYTREVGTPLLFKLFDYKRLNGVYYAYHTQSMEWVVAALLDAYGLTEDIFDKNKRLMAYLRQHANEDIGGHPRSEK